MRERGILPELEVFDLGMLNYAFYLQRKGLLPRDCYVNLMLGSLGTVPGRMLDLANLVREIPRNWTWAAAGIGRYQLPVNTAAILMGGHVRVGLEDNPYYDYATREPASNRQLVERLVRLARELGRPVATGDEIRARLKPASRDNWAATRATASIHAGRPFLRPRSRATNASNSSGNTSKRPTNMDSDSSQVAVSFSELKLEAVSPKPIPILFRQAATEPNAVTRSTPVAVRASEKKQ